MSDTHTGDSHADDISGGAARRLSGGCHCGAVRYTVSLDLSHTIACNCSLCASKGLILAFAPESAFELEAGEAKLREYRFNRHVISHMFCADCGVESFARAPAPDGTPTVAINVRTLSGIDPATLSPVAYDGRAA
ncbi:GFA family protein [Starkeya koreensis]|uniref:GFA family protein n=1 Tax=Ancylobacter koreensis TaxID=266121 RepID=A0ABT0DND8_9HYPH|nr:GFA family protein [Ancylobacter koreensis]MCK0208788.1 GFA family protein [Ancylobacter koreensis]